GDAHPAALALRTPDGQRALLPAEAVTAVDPDSQQVLVPAGTEIYALDAPRIEAGDGSLAAHWQTLGAVVHADGASSTLGEPPSEPLAISRAATATRERPLWQVVAFALTMLGALILAEIGADFLVAYLVTGNPPY